jgi:hypothetical protein
VENGSLQPRYLICENNIRTKKQTALQDGSKLSLTSSDKSQFSSSSSPFMSEVQWFKPEKSSLSISPLKLLELE